MKWLLNLFHRAPAPLPTAGTGPTPSMEVYHAMLTRKETEFASLKQNLTELLGGLSPVPETAEHWTAEDRGLLLQFLRAPTGAKLLLALRQNHEALKDQACDDTEKRVDHARGQAVGFRKAIASLIILSAPPPPQGETATKSEDGADELRENLSHQ